MANRTSPTLILSICDTQAALWIWRARYLMAARLASRESPNMSIFAKSRPIFSPFYA
jgi:hypothetical protein